MPWPDATPVIEPVKSRVVEGAVARKMVRVNAVSAFDCDNKYESRFGFPAENRGRPVIARMNNCDDKRGINNTSDATLSGGDELEPSEKLRRETGFKG